MIRKFLAKLPLLIWFVPGLLLAAAFPPFGETCDAFFALAPLVWCARHFEPKRSFRCWLSNGLVFWLVSLGWLTSVEGGGATLAMVLVGWLLLAAYCALYFGIFGWLAAHVWRWTKGRGYGWRLAAIVIAEPLLWGGLELIRSRLASGFSWNQLGLAPINSGNALFGLPACLGGVYLVSMVVILVNGMIVSVVERMLEPFFRARGKAELAEIAPGVSRMLRSAETVLPTLALVVLYWLAAVAPSPAKGPSHDVTFGLLQRQAPVDKNLRTDPDRDYEAMIDELNERVIASCGRLVDVLVLPESAFADVGAVDSAAAKLFVERRLAAAGAVSVIAGGVRFEDDRVYNCAATYCLDSTRRVVSREIYDKVHLVLAGEYIPGDKTFPWLQQFAVTGSCTPGEPRSVRLKARGFEFRAGTLICFEDTDSWLSREIAADGAQALVFITNDVWFPRSAETMQHAWQATARAFETGLPVVRVGNSGVSGIVLPGRRPDWLRGADGRALVDCRAVGYGTVPVPEAGAAAVRTIYVRWGDAPLFLAFLLLITTMGVIKYKHEYEKRRTVSL